MIEDKVIIFNNGLKMPALGFGTWKSKPGEVAKAVEHAIKVGYRHVDCAAAYANESEVGEGIRNALKDSQIQREDIFITSKLENTKHMPEHVEAACQKTLSDLGLSYVDLYLIHWPHGFAYSATEAFPKDENGALKYDFDTHYVDTWLAMEKLVEKGLARSIGLSNFNSKQIEEILQKGKGWEIFPNHPHSTLLDFKDQQGAEPSLLSRISVIKPVTNQVECHPYFNQEPLREFCAKHGIFLTAYSPLGSPDRPWAKPDEPQLLQDPKLAEIAKEHSKTPAQIIIKWQIQRGLSVIPKSVTPSRIEQNADIGGFELNEEQMKGLMAFNKGRDGRLIEPLKPNGERRDKHHPFYPFQDDIEF